MLLEGAERSKRRGGRPKKTHGCLWKRRNEFEYKKRIAAGRQKSASVWRPKPEGAPKKNANVLKKLGSALLKTKSVARMMLERKPKTSPGYWPKFRKGFV